MPAVELSTVVFYRGDLARELLLRDCSMPLAHPPRHVLVTMYGTQGKQDGFRAARDHAASLGVSYTVIDLVLDVGAQNPQVMKQAELPAFDFMNLERASRALCDDLAQRLCANSELGSALVAKLSSRPLREVMASHPALGDAIMALPECRHLKLLAFKTPPAQDGRPISMGLLHHRAWTSIREATCRLDPNVHVRLDPPL